LGTLVSGCRRFSVRRRIEGVSFMEKVLQDREPEVIEVEDLDIEELQERIVPSRYSIAS
jgi:hypothetical protein